MQAVPLLTWFQFNKIYFFVKKASKLVAVEFLPNSASMLDFNFFFMGETREDPISLLFLSTILVNSFVVTGPGKSGIPIPTKFAYVRSFGVNKGVKGRSESSLIPDGRVPFSAMYASQEVLNFEKKISNSSFPSYAGGSKAQSIE